MLRRKEFYRLIYRLCRGQSLKHSKKARPLSRSGLFELNPAASYSPIRRPYSTIGAGGLNGRVRDGIGCDTSAIATGSLKTVSSDQVSVRKLKPENRHLPTTFKLNTSTLHSRGVALVNMVKPHDQLVPVSFNHYWPSTSGLSTS